MRIAMLVLCVLLPTLGLADDWKPPNNPDPQAILQEAKADTRRGDYKIALAKHLWFHENAVKLRPGQSAVRLSFALSNWLELGEAYPPALEKMRQVRDETEERIRNQNRVRVRFVDFHDFVALNRTLRQEERTAKAFRWLDEADAEDAKRVFNVAKAALIKQKAYDLCGKYIDPKRDLPLIRDSYAMGLKLGARFGKDHQEFVEKKFLNDTAILVAILTKNNRVVEAEKAAEEAMSFVTAPATLTKLQRELESALSGTVPNPWP